MSCYVFQIKEEWILLVIGLNTVKSMSILFHICLSDQYCGVKLNFVADHITITAAVKWPLLTVTIFRGRRVYRSRVGSGLQGQKKFTLHLGCSHMSISVKHFYLQIFVSISDEDRASRTVRHRLSVLRCQSCVSARIPRECRPVSCSSFAKVQ